MLEKAALTLTTASGLVDTVRVMWRTLAIVEGKLKNETKELAAWTKLVALEPQDVEANRRVRNDSWRTGNSSRRRSLHSKSRGDRNAGL